MLRQKKFGDVLEIEESLSSDSDIFEDKSRQSCGKVLCAYADKPVGLAWMQNLVICIETAA